MKKTKRKPVPPVYVGKSTIHDKGLFAARNINKGELIGEFKYRPGKKDGAHVFWIDEDQVYQVPDNFK